VRALAAFAAAVALALLAAAPAAAAPATTKREPHPRVDTLSVSDPAPSRDSAIDVFSSGWRPNAEVEISLAGTALRRARADANGAVQTEVMIPSTVAAGSEWLSVTGTSARGVPQQIVTELSVVGTDPPRSAPRPWLAISLLLAVATLLMLVNERVERRERPTRLAA
jgi:hypothetical protein